MGDTIRVPDPEPDKTVKATLRLCGACGRPYEGASHQGCPAATAPTAPADSASTRSAEATTRLDEVPLEARPFENDPARRLHQYILVRTLGKGGMGEVWKAWDGRLTRWVAVKFLLGRGEEDILRFQREAKLAARLKHPHIATIHEIGEAPSRQAGQPTLHYLAMEYIDGGSLAQAKLGIREGIEVFIKVAQAVERAHQGGVVHRDLKPANIMLTQEGWPVVMDFGLAKPLGIDTGLSASGAVMGTPAYMPPEQVEGKLDEIGPESDVYALGATMYAVFCGSAPFSASSTLQVLRKVCTDPPAPPRSHNPALPPPLEAVILKALSKRKQDRPPTAAALGEELQRVLQTLETAPTVVAPDRAKEPARRGIGLWIGAAALLIGTAAAGFVLLRRTDPPPAPPPAVAEKSVPAPPAPPPASSPPAVAPPPAPVAEPPAAPPRAAPAAADIDAAASRAAAFLERRLAGRPLEGASDLLAVWALLQGPEGLREPRLGLAVADVLRRPPTSVRAAALTALAIEASGDSALRARLVPLARALLEAQRPDGAWPAVADLSVPPAPEEPFLVLGGRPLDPAATDVEGVPRGQGEPSVRVTHDVLLALAACVRAGVRLPGAVWARARGALDVRTAGGAAAAALCGPAPESPREADPGHPLAALAARERADALLEGPTSFAEDARRLLETQQPDGSWTEGGDPVESTAQALLVLTRATARARAAPPPPGPGTLETRAVGGPPSVFVVLDCSGAMRQEDGGRERFDLARERVRTLAEALPEGSRFGLRAFGARHGALEPGAETDTHLVVPFGPLDRAQVRASLASLRVRGKAMLSLALRETARDLADAPPATLVLLVDGRDSDRRGDPIAALGALAAARPGTTAVVVGFNDEDDEVKERLSAMAAAVGGRRAKPSDDLGALAGDDRYVIEGDDGRVVAEGRLGDRRTLPSGRYTLRRGAIRRDLRVEAGRTARAFGKR